MSSEGYYVNPDRTFDTIATIVSVTIAIAIAVVLFIAIYRADKAEKAKMDSMSEQEYCLYRYSEYPVKSVPAKCAKYFGI